MKAILPNFWSQLKGCMILLYKIYLSGPSHQLLPQVIMGIKYYVRSILLKIHTLKMAGLRNSHKQFLMLLQWSNPSIAAQVATLERMLQI